MASQQTGQQDIAIVSLIMDILLSKYVGVKPLLLRMLGLGASSLLLVHFS